METADVPRRNDYRNTRPGGRTGSVVSGRQGLPLTKNISLPKKITRWGARCYPRFKESLAPRGKQCQPPLAILFMTCALCWSGSRTRFLRCLPILQRRQAATMLLLSELPPSDWGLRCSPLHWRLFACFKLISYCEANSCGESFHILSSQ